MQKKLLFIFLLAVTIICIFTIDSYASYEYIFSFSDKGVDLPDVQVTSYAITSPNYTLLFYDKSTKKYIFWVSEQPFSYSNVINNGSYFYIGVNEGKFCEYLYKEKDKKWTENRIDSTAPYTTGGYWASPENALYSSYDVYYNDELLVHAYVGSPLVKSISQISTIDTVTSEIVSIFPVTLTITVGLIGIRKAIAFIRNKLRNA